LAVLGASCGRPSHEPFLTYFNGDFGISLRYPASWRTEQAEQDGLWYRYFLGPPQGPQAKPGVSVTLLAGPLQGSLEEHAQGYLAGNSLASARDESRQGVKGRSYAFASADGATRYSLLLLQDQGKLYGLYAQGDAGAITLNQATLEEMFKSLTFERAEAYPEIRNTGFAFRLRLPPSWRETRHFGGRDTLLLQFTSPALGADKGGATVHASLSLTVETLPAGGDLESFYQASQDRLGSAFQTLAHGAWRGGYADSLRSETPMAVSRVKRFYLAAGRRGYCLSFEARDDVFHRVSRWCDLIAGTLRVGVELGAS
jgi:hypothetical protein